MYAVMCGWCGKLLAADELVWIEQVDVYATGAGRWLVPVGAECASPDFRAGSEGKEPERCFGCERGVYYRTARRGRRLTLCSRRCATLYQAARRKERRGS